jgi:hypothetical protein
MQCRDGVGEVSGQQEGFDDVATVLQSEVMGDVMHKTVELVLIMM